VLLNRLLFILKHMVIRSKLVKRRQEDHILFHRTIHSMATSQSITRWVILLWQEERLRNQEIQMVREYLLQIIYD
jgi:hypothetical protein